MPNKGQKRWKCLRCGRDKFTEKTPHRCNGQYRKGGIWQQIDGPVDPPKPKPQPTKWHSI